MDNILNILSGGNKNEGWIVGPTYDRLFFVFPWIFGIFFPLLYLVLHRYSGLSDDTTIKIVFFCYLTFLNLPHVYLTYIRSNFDAKEFYRRKNFHTWTPILFLISGIPIYFYDTHDLFFLFYPILGPWHAMRQDWGFLKLYRLKYNEKDNEKLDYWFFHGQRILIMLTFQIFHVLNYF